MLIDCEQGSGTWHDWRCGRVTASRVCDVMAKIKSGEAASRRNYRAEIVAEILTQVPTEHYVSREMMWGVEKEPEARTEYELRSGVLVDIVGFATHPVIERFGASPDGIVGEDGLCEFKCPNTATHLDYLLAGVVPSEYQPQMLAEMACTGRQWVDFVSFDPRMPAEFQLFIRRFPRDEKRIAGMEAAVVDFLAEVDEVIASLKSCVAVQGKAVMA